MLLDVKKHLVFEEFVKKIFIEAGYNTPEHCQQSDSAYDFIAEKDGISYCVEVKYSQIMFSPSAFKNLTATYSFAKTHNMIPILSTAFKIKKKEEEYYKKAFPDLILLDIANLLFAVRDNTKLYNELISELPFTVDDIEPQEGFIKLNSLQHDDYADSLIKELKSCKPGKSWFRKYEEICFEALKYIFSDDLSLWKEQQKSNQDLFRFDLLCRIKEGNQRDFWSIVEKHFNSKYIIFEFKNHREKITQKEIYTTEKYLYSKALRSTGIIISQKGYDDNAYWASKGCLRENGKLIILLTSDDLIEMCRMKLKSNDPSNYLLDKLDELLSELEK